MLDNYCIRCGSPITDRQARFCAGCGNQLRTAPPSGISRGGIAAIIVASVSALALIGGVAWFMVWLTGDHAHTTHGVRFHEADFDVQTASDLDAYRAGADWMVRLTPDSTAMKERPGRAHRAAVATTRSPFGSQVIMLVCFDSPKAKPDVLRQCDRIADTIIPAPAG